MNTFKAVVLLCAVLGASCSQHFYNHRNWESPSMPSTGASSYSQAQKQTQTWSAPATEAPLNAYGPASAPAPSTPFVSSSHNNEAPATPATIHQVCTCVNLPPAPAAPEVSAYSAPAAPAKSVNSDAQQAYDAPATPALQRPATSAAYPPAKAY